MSVRGTAPRRAIPERRLPVAGLVVAGLARAGATAGGVWFVTREAPAPNDPLTTPATCPEPRTLAVDPVWAMPLAQVLTARQGLVGCQTLVVEERTTSDIAARGLAGAVAWVPADESVPGRAGTTARADAPRTVVAESPIVLVSEGATGRAMGAGQPTGDLLTGLARPSPARTSGAST